MRMTGAKVRWLKSVQVNEVNVRSAKARITYFMEIQEIWHVKCRSSIKVFDGSVQ